MCGEHIYTEIFRIFEDAKSNTSPYSRCMRGSFHSPNVERDRNSQANIFVDAFLQLSKPVSFLNEHKHNLGGTQNRQKKNMRLFTANEGPTLITCIWFNIKRQQNYIISICSKCFREEKKNLSIEYLCRNKTFPLKSVIHSLKNKRISVFYLKLLKKCLLKKPFYQVDNVERFKISPFFAEYS